MKDLFMGLGVLAIVYALTLAFDASLPMTIGVMGFMSWVYGNGIPRKYGMTVNNLWAGR